MTTKPKTRKATAPNDTLDTVEGLGERLDDLDLADAIDEIKRRGFGLHAAIRGASFTDIEEKHGLSQLASDISNGVERLAKAFEAERKLREAEQRQ